MPVLVVLVPTPLSPINVRPSVNLLSTSPKHLFNLIFLSLSTAVFLELSCELSENLEVEMKVSKTIILLAKFTLSGWVEKEGVSLLPTNTC